MNVNCAPIRISKFTRVVVQAEGERIGEVPLHELDDENLQQLIHSAEVIQRERSPENMRLARAFGDWIDRRYGA